MSLELTRIISLGLPLTLDPTLTFQRQLESPAYTPLCGKGALPLTPRGNFYNSAATTGQQRHPSGLTISCLFQKYPLLLERSVPSGIRHIDHVPRTLVVTSRSTHAPRPCEPHVTLAVAGQPCHADGWICLRTASPSSGGSVGRLTSSTSGELLPDPNRDERAKAMAMLASASPGSPTVLRWPFVSERCQRPASWDFVPPFRPCPSAACVGPRFKHHRPNKFHKSKSAALATASCVVATSEATPRLLRKEYDVAHERIRVVRPGIDRLPEALGSGCSRVRLLSGWLYPARERI